MVVDWEGTGNYVHCARCGRYFDTPELFGEHVIACLQRSKQLRQQRFRQPRFVQRVDQFKRRLVRLRRADFRDLDAPSLSSSQEERINAGLRAKRIRSVEWSLEELKTNNKRHRWWQRRQK